MQSNLETNNRDRCFAWANGETPEIVVAFRRSSQESSGYADGVLSYQFLHRRVEFNQIECVIGAAKLNREEGVILLSPPEELVGDAVQIYWLDQKDIYASGFEVPQIVFLRNLHTVGAYLLDVDGRNYGTGDLGKAVRIDRKKLLIPIGFVENGRNMNMVAKSFLENHRVYRVTVQETVPKPKWGDSEVIVL
jgi:hypothetical protein